PVRERTSRNDMVLCRSRLVVISTSHINRAVRETLPQPPLRAAHAGAPTVVGSLAAIHGSFERCIWLGTGTRDAHPSPWTTQERTALRQYGLAIDDGTNALVGQRRAERRGLAQIRGNVLGISLPHDEEQRPHPIWQQLSTRAAPTAQPLAVSIERALTTKSPSAPFSGTNGDPTIFRIPLRRVTPLPLSPPLDTWSLDPALLTERTYSSATELQTRLACPLQWVLNYQARLRRGSTARLPSSFLLKGRFCHAVLEEVLQGDGPLPSPDEAVAAVGQAFDARLPLDAAPLAQPAAAAERTQLRHQLTSSTRVLIEALALGGYRITKMESEFNGTISDRPLKGYIDCLAVDQDGNEAVIDFKYGGAAKYRKLLREGRAVQLAIYAGARHAERGGTYPQVAYLIISDHAVHTPSGNPLAGASPTSLVPGAPDLAEVWRNFQLALDCAEGWLESGEIPVRPLQDITQWPLGANLVLSETPQQRVEQDVCRYCDYRSLCGIEEAR
ncbi:MAG: PD-(D/E)XK nuclease family protein, partial [Planctomycetota bacterium]